MLLSFFLSFSHQNESNKSRRSSRKGFIVANSNKKDLFAYQSGRGDGCSRTCRTLSFAIPLYIDYLQGSKHCKTQRQSWWWYFFKKIAIHGLFSIYFSKQNNTTLTTIKNVHPVSGAGIWTHDLLNMSLLQLPEDQDTYTMVIIFRVPSWEPK